VIFYKSVHARIPFINEGIKTMFCR